MNINKNFVFERLDDEGAILLDPENEVIYTLNKFGYLVLDTAINCGRECAKNNYFKRAKIPVTNEYLNDYNLCLNQLIENKILLEE